MEALDVIKDLRNYYASYHNHKETMAYGATTLYVGAATVVILKGHGLFLNIASIFILSTLLWSAFVAGHAFLIWQLNNREVAARVVSAASEVLSRLSDPANKIPPNMTPQRWRCQWLPADVVEKLTHPSHRFQGGARTATFV